MAEEYNLHGYSNSFGHQSNINGGGSQTSSDITSTDNRVALNLRKSDSLLALIETKIILQRKQNEELSRNRPNKALSSSASSSASPEKQKASNFAISSLRIGSWERRSSHEGELVGKVYFAKRRLVWEVLDGPLKSKFEMQWDDITAIRLSREVLDIQLRQPPAMFKETPPQPKKHTNWEPHESLNFTGGQAATHVRRHRVTFHPGVFERHYEQLLRVDERLFDLSQKPFPYHESQYFPIQHPIPRQRPQPPAIAQYPNPLTIKDRISNRFVMPQTQPYFPQISMPQTQPCFPQIRMHQARPYFPQMNIPLPSPPELSAITQPFNFPDHVNNAQDDLMDYANDIPLSEDCFQATGNIMQTLDGFQTEHVELPPYPESNIILDHDCQTEPMERPPYPEAALGSIPIMFLPEAADGRGSYI